MRPEIRIPFLIYQNRKHRKNIEAVTGAAVMPHDHATVEAACSSLDQHVKIVERYIELKVAK